MAVEAPPIHIHIQRSQRTANLKGYRLACLKFNTIRRYDCEPDRYTPARNEFPHPRAQEKCNNSVGNQVQCYIFHQLITFLFDSVGGRKSRRSVTSTFAFSSAAHIFLENLHLYLLQIQIGSLCLFRVGKIHTHSENKWELF